ncbi:cellulose biosynthesis cyclic di-GMP-binding regulatory protein BcsB [Terrihabitans rhizophilus]|uniref:Cyclic di-GMP-binding protein n=1 Tax=Terrihabitans rhizophilus TaxID=3092662 RepID=A0ABU4RPD8_9HYPH|nr:cellulose biosynthesis cyclic di-GMP-binding regulatory protein BcsB [Terrihabitans sp. PJ23]MDX6806471.1 cellulose biosynthesis cyclic di-GMP-binding regulatory protein BcsB [Terrihabitans sp. PJ23]
MLRGYLLAIALAALATGPAAAQSGGNVAPFDIGGTGVRPAPREPEPALQPEPQAPVAPEAAQPAAAQISRYLVPFPTMRLQGEIDNRSWVLHLTRDEADENASLSLRYLNSVMVMPEASRLRIFINGTRVLEQAISSSNEPGRATAPIPAGVLQAGPNTIRVQAVMYHRTDCTTQSTFELWTDVQPEGTGLVLGNQSGAPRITNLEDLASVGFDVDGRTTIRVLVPSSGQSQVAAPLMRLSQAVALRGHFAHPQVRVYDRASDVPTAGPGMLTIVMGTGPDLPRMLARPPAEALARASVVFAEDAKLGPVAIVGGPTWTEVRAAVDSVAAALERPVSVPRTSLDTTGWLAPEPPFITEPRSVRLADLGVPTQEFAGRVFRTRFAVGLPSDFFANAYGTGTLYLDAAYGASVLPASHLDVYVNGNLASTLTLTEQEGRIYRHFPLDVPLRHFRPGVNQMMIEAVVNTAQDAACAPGATIPGSSRFVLFDTTEFAVPRFARLGKRPDLAATAGTGFPYNRAPQPTGLILGRQDAVTFSAAATLMARMAQAAGRPIALDTTMSPANATSRNAIFVGAVGQMPPGVLNQLKLAEDIATSWRAPDMQQAAFTPSDPYVNALEAYQRSLSVRDPRQTKATPEPRDTEEVYDRWREDLSGGGGIRGQYQAFREWLERKFDLSSQSLSILPAEEALFTPAPATALLMTQGGSPDGAGTWTLVSAPTGDALLTSVSDVAAPGLWNTIGGRVSTYEAVTGRVRVQAPSRLEYVQTQPLAATNARLIAANWLSANTVYYASGLLLLCTLLGAYTFNFLGRLGRQS